MTANLRVIKLLLLDHRSYRRKGGEQQRAVLALRIGTLDGAAFGMVLGAWLSARDCHLLVGLGGFQNELSL